MTKRFFIIGLAVSACIFSVSCSRVQQQGARKNIVVGAVNNTKEEAKPVKLENGIDPQKQEDKKEANDLEKYRPDETHIGEDKKSSKAKEAYLTFDDGPTKNITPEILDILKEKDVKATFFVIGKMAEANKELLMREKNDGHAIANHSYSHDYKYLYANPNNFVDDINKADGALKTAFEGYNSKLIRFPGGSFGKEREAYRQAITEAGYHFVDWNAVNGDAEGKGNWPAEKLVERLKTTCAGKNRLVILMHDAPLKHSTVQALPEIIEYLKSQGYNFKTLE